MATPYIKNGTPVGTTSLCRTCTYAHIMTGCRESEQVTMCNGVHPNIVVPFLIYECTHFYDKNRPTWQQMQDLALDVVTTPMKPVGFKTGPGFVQTTLVRPSVADEGND